MDALVNKGRKRKTKKDLMVVAKSHKRARSDLMQAKPKKEKVFARHRRQISIQDSEMRGS